MPRLQATTDGTNTVIVATLYQRPALIKETKLASDYLVVTLPIVKGRLGGQVVKVAEKIKVELGTNDAAKARARALATPGSTILARDGKRYRAVAK
jgi:hypothetical protein